jgi:predicted transcriptional regulator
LPAQTETPKQPNQKQQFLETLPPEFSRQDYLTIAKNLNIPDKTAQRHIEKYLQTNLIERISHGNYRKR